MCTFCSTIIICMTLTCRKVFLNLFASIDFSHQVTESDTRNGVSESAEGPLYFGPLSSQVSFASTHSVAPIDGADATVTAFIYSTPTSPTNSHKMVSTWDTSLAPPTTFMSWRPTPHLSDSRQPHMTTIAIYRTSSVSVQSSHAQSTLSTVSATPTKAPTGRTSTTIDYKLIICVVVPSFTVLVFVIVVAMVLCIRRYRK